MRVIVGMSGASGAIYGVRLLEQLAKIEGVETHLVVSRAAELTLVHETTYRLEDVKGLANSVYDIDDIGAPIASGSFRADGMVVAPCSIKTLAGIAHSYNDNLLIRAADVTLKERKKLILLVRETPLHLGHIKLMEQATLAGAIIMPPVPAFYHRPQKISDIIDYTVGKILDLLSLSHDLYDPWPGDKFKRCD